MSMFKKTNLSMWLSCCLGMTGVSVWADDYKNMVEQIDQLKANQVEYSIALEEGKDRSMLCGYCHGKDGNSVKSEIPNLASQNTEYLLKQFQLFATGERKSYVMQQLARSLNAEEKINLALYFSAQTVRPQEGLQTSAKGKARYDSLCIACHGQDGRGNHDLPRVAGQKKDFLVKTLTGFKQGKAARATSPMVNIMKVVEASEIESLADYIATMP
ncbi:MAG: cytochrome c553 [Oceanicoccus sp.]|jgi:cytochrome c553